MTITYHVFLFNLGNCFQTNGKASNLKITQGIQIWFQSADTFSFVWLLIINYAGKKKNSDIYLHIYPLNITFVVMRNIHTHTTSMCSDTTIGY